MTTKTTLIDYALAYGWYDDDLAALEQALAKPTEDVLEEAPALFGECHCPAVEYCELAVLLLEWCRECLLITPRATSWVRSPAGPNLSCWCCTTFCFGGID